MTALSFSILVMCLVNCSAIHATYYEYLSKEKRRYIADTWYDMIVDILLSINTE